MKDKGLHIILEQVSKEKFDEWLELQKQNPGVESALSLAGIASEETKNCAICSEKNPKDRAKPLVNEDDTKTSDTLKFKDIYIKNKTGDLRNLEDELEIILENDILYDVDVTEEPFKSLPDIEKEKYEELTSNELTRIKYICYILNSLVELMGDSNSTTDAVRQALKYWKKVCAKFKVKFNKGTKKKIHNKKEDDVDKIIGCMDPNSLSYNKKYNTPCGGEKNACCTYEVRLAPISYNISFYKQGKFPSEVDYMMQMDDGGYTVCVQKRVYDTIGVDGIWDGYQDNSEISLSKLEKDRFVFNGDVGFYKSPNSTLISDVKRAMTLYMNKVSKNTDTVGDNCIVAPINMDGITIEIKDGKGVNHGVIRFGGDEPTLRIDAPTHAKWLDYRASNTPSGREQTSNDIKFYNPGDDFNSFYKMTCERYNNVKSWTSKSGFECVKTDDDGWLIVRKGVSESTIGLGTLLGRKDKPITGLGSLLED